jgi:hypothetical protein
LINEPISVAVAVLIQVPQPIYVVYGMQRVQKTARNFLNQKKIENFHFYIGKYTMEDKIRDTNCIKLYFLDLASLKISQILGNNKSLNRFTFSDKASFYSLETLVQKRMSVDCYTQPFLLC